MSPNIFFDEDTPLIKFISQIPDPRVNGRCKHKLTDILIIAICSVLCAVDTWEEIELFANARIDWFKKYLELPHGIPSHDTFLRVFKIINPEIFEQVFFDWIQSVIELKKGQIIALDGKTVNGTCRNIRADRGRRLSLVNVWSTEAGLCLGQMKATSTGSPELVTIKEILKLLNVEGMLLTVDAASGLRSFTEESRRRKADYLFPIKRNHKKLARDLKGVFAAKKIKKVKFTEKLNHKGRKEKRTCFVIKDLRSVGNIVTESNFVDLKTLGMIIYERIEKDNRLVKKEIVGNRLWKWTKIEGTTRHSFEVKFYASSLELAPYDLIKKVKQHWEIENKLNWCLDVHLREDANRTRDKVAAENMSLVRKLVLNLVRKEDSFKKSLKLKMKKCLYSETYLEKVLFQTNLN